LVPRPRGRCKNARNLSLLHRHTLVGTSYVARNRHLEPRWPFRRWLGNNRRSSVMWNKN
ncbi:unnamed protein product, partial [Amoebophrya sp. A120]